MSPNPHQPSRAIAPIDAQTVPAPSHIAKASKIAPLAPAAIPPAPRPSIPPPVEARPRDARNISPIPHKPKFHPATPRAIPSTAKSPIQNLPAASPNAPEPIAPPAPPPAAIPRQSPACKARAPAIPPRASPKSAISHKTQTHRPQPPPAQPAKKTSAQPKPPIPPSPSGCAKKPAPKDLALLAAQIIKINLRNQFRNHVRLAALAQNMPLKFRQAHRSQAQSPKMPRRMQQIQMSLGHLRRNRPSHPVTRIQKRQIKRFPIESNQHRPLRNPFLQSQKYRMLLAMIAHKKLLHLQPAAIPPCQTHKKRISPRPPRKPGSLGIQKKPIPQIRSQTRRPRRNQSKRFKRSFKRRRLLPPTPQNQVLAELVGCSLSPNQGSQPFPTARQFQRISARKPPLRDLRRAEEPPTYPKVFLRVPSSKFFFFTPKFCSKSPLPQPCPLQGPHKKGTHPRTRTRQSILESAAKEFHRREKTAR